MLDRTVPPEFHTIDSLHIRQAEKVPTNNNLPFYFIRSGTQNVLKIEMILKGGSWFENKSGVSSITSKMLSEGTKSYSSIQISESFDGIGAFFEISTGSDYQTLSFYLLEKHLLRILPLIKEILEEPLIPEEELITVKNISSQTLRVNFQKSSFESSKLYRQQLFGDAHPYGNTVKPEDIQLIDRSDVNQHYNESIKGNVLLAVASGNFEDSTLNHLKDFFGNCYFNQKMSDKNPSIRSSDNKYLYKEKDDAVQSSIRLGSFSISPHHDDYFKLLVANETLGGYFGSRLMKNIREEKGLTYGIYSQLVNLKSSSYWVIGADVKKDLVEQAIEEVKKEIKKLRTDKVGKEELETVRNYLLGQIQSSISTPFALADKFKTIYLRGFDYSYFDNMVDTIKNITSSEILDTMNNYMDEDNMYVVVVG